jgi:hypothetical protein
MINSDTEHKVSELRRLQQKREGAGGVILGLWIFRSGLGWFGLGLWGKWRISWHGGDEQYFSPFLYVVSTVNLISDP